MLYHLHSILLFIYLSNVILGQNKPIALIGRILLTDHSIQNGTLLIINEHIAAVGDRITIPRESIVVHTKGIILPGLIDLHNHLMYNIFPRWKPNQEFGSRYDWQQKPIYQILIQAPQKALLQAGLECQMQLYAEIKAITQGATSVIGGLRKPCNQGLARNLDDDPTLGQILYNVFPLQMTEKAVYEAKQALSANGTLLIHLAEGSPDDAPSAREFIMLESRDLLKPGVSIIHGVALQDEHFRLMANASVGFVWSLRSNLELYGYTANIEAALRNHVTVAIAPDWSPTGSDGLLSELNYAATWNTIFQRPLFDDQMLLAMATVNPAKLIHQDQRLGALKEGYLADVLVLRESNNDPFWTATHSTPEDVMLVLINGEPIYGDPKMMQNFFDTEQLESLDICGVEKSIHFNSQTSFHQTQKLLKNALRRSSRTLAPLSECGN